MSWSDNMEAKWNETGRDLPELVHVVNIFHSPAKSNRSMHFIDPRHLAFIFLLVIISSPVISPSLILMFSLLELSLAFKGTTFWSESSRYEVSALCHSQLLDQWVSVGLFWLLYVVPPYQVWIHAFQLFCPDFCSPETNRRKKIIIIIYCTQEGFLSLHIFNATYF